MTEQRNSISIEITTREVEFRESNVTSSVKLSDNQSLSKTIETLQLQTNQGLEVQQRNQEVMYELNSTLDK